MWHRVREEEVLTTAAEAFAFFAGLRLASAWAMARRDGAGVHRPVEPGVTPPPAAGPSEAVVGGFCTRRSGKEASTGVRAGG